MYQLILILLSWTTITALTRNQADEVTLIFDTLLKFHMSQVEEQDTQLGDGYFDSKGCVAVVCVNPENVCKFTQTFSDNQIAGNCTKSMEKYKSKCRYEPISGPMCMTFRDDIYKKVTSLYTSKNK